MSDIKTVTLGGDELKIEGMSGQNTAVINKSGGAVYASKSPDIVPGADGVTEIDAGAQGGLYGTNGEIYLLGTGKVELHGTDHALNFRQPSSGSGASGGGSSGVSQEYVDNADAMVLKTAKEYTDQHIPEDVVATEAEVNEMLDSIFGTHTQVITIPTSSVSTQSDIIAFMSEFNETCIPENMRTDLVIDTTWGDVCIRLQNGNFRIIAMGYKRQSTAIEVVRLWNGWKSNDTYNTGVSWSYMKYLIGYYRDNFAAGFLTDNQKSPTKGTGFVLAWKDNIGILIDNGSERNNQNATVTTIASPTVSDTVVIEPYVSTAFGTAVENVWICKSKPSDVDLLGAEFDINGVTVKMVSGNIGVTI